MISPSDFCAILADADIDHFYGVPDSLLSSLCAFLDNSLDKQSHVIAANEGTAMAVAAGYYLGSGKPAAVYMQNSGLGNTVNPLTSLCDMEVYSLPMLMIIGWRGEPGVKDEPQHVKQGAITLEQLELLNIPYCILQADSNFDEMLMLLSTMKSESRPVAVVVKKDTFEPITPDVRPHPFKMKREQALSAILASLPSDAMVVSTTGKTSREVFELRKAEGAVNRDFLTVGGMGHTSSIGLGVATAQPKKLTVVLDGDGSVLMHMGALAVIGDVAPKRFIHVVLNNQSHESVGGQPTVINSVDLKSLALSCGYNSFVCVSSESDIKEKFAELPAGEGPVLVEVQIAPGSRKDLGRPTSTPVENKLAFMQHAQGNSQ